MKLIVNIIKAVLTIVPTGLSVLSCVYENGECEDLRQDVIRVNTSALDGTMPNGQEPANAFTVLFWEHPDNLSTASGDARYWRTPYHVSQAPQPVSYYNKNTYNTNYPYPRLSTVPVYATGFAPNILDSVATYGYKRLAAIEGSYNKGRCDFLSCDAWNEVYKGSQNDPFSQEKNKLYFRHLASKLVFYADRDENMENRQHVRNVQIKNLTMSIDDGKTWTPMYTPSVFEWKAFDEDLDEDYFTDSYNEVITKVTMLAGNEHAKGTKPQAGYKAIAAEEFAGGPRKDEATDETEEFILQRNSTDRIPIDGTVLDSCYVCSRLTEDGSPVEASPAILLRMDISAELSYDPDFPMPDTDGGSTTDDITFTRVWEGVTVTIYETDKNGQIPTAAPTPVKVFKPGREYRVYINFNRTGVNLVAKELPWDFGGIYYITIVGGDTSQEKQPQESIGQEL